MTIEEKLAEFEEYASISIHTYMRECLAMLKKAIEQRDHYARGDIHEELFKRDWNAELLRAGEIK